MNPSKSAPNPSLDQRLLLAIDLSTNSGAGAMTGKGPARKSAASSESEARGGDISLRKLSKGDAKT